MQNWQIFGFFTGGSYLKTSKKMVLDQRKQLETITKERDSLSANVETLKADLQYVTKKSPHEAALKVLQEKFDALQVEKTDLLEQLNKERI